MPTQSGEPIVNRLHLELDASALLERVAANVPESLRNNAVVIGSIATAWAFREVSGTNTVATKDIDLLLRPGIDAVSTAITLGQVLLEEGWQPRFPQGRERATADMADDELPALRLTPPGGEDGWFLELLAAPPFEQKERKHWQRFVTSAGIFGLPSFRYMPVAVFDAEQTVHGLRVAKPACMALAHLLEHAEPNRTPISGLPGNPPRFVKDIGRAVALWWLAGQASVTAAGDWRAAWGAVMDALYPNHRAEMLSAARTGLHSLEGHVRDAHQLAMTSVLASHGTTLGAFQRAYAGLFRLLEHD